MQSSSIKGLAMGARVRHVENGLGTVVLRTKWDVGVRFDNGCFGTYGWSYFRVLPKAVVDLTPPRERQEKPDAAA